MTEEYVGATVTGVCAHCGKTYVRPAHEGYTCECGLVEGEADDAEGIDTSGDDAQTPKEPPAPQDAVQEVEAPAPAILEPESPAADAPSAETSVK